LLFCQQAIMPGGNIEIVPARLLAGMMACDIADKAA
jgi:hypothetical protein